MAKKILVVDDEPDILESVKMRLEANGYEVATARSGSEGIKKAQAELPDLIVLDILMPDIDGGIVAEELKNKPATKDIPIIFLTCIVKEEEAQNRSSIGGNVFVAKPFKPEELLDKIRGILDR